MHVENYVGFLVSQGIIEEADQEIYCYGFKVLLFNAICILSVMAIGLFLGLLPETVSFLIGFFGMRLYAGGYHAATEKRCYGLFMMTYLLFCWYISIFPQFNIIVLSAIMCFCVASVLKFAPIADQSVKESAEKFGMFRRRCLLICGMNLLIVCLFVGYFPNNTLLYSYTLGFIVECVSIIAEKIFNKNINYY